MPGEVLLVDKSDNQVGYSTVEAAHEGQGKHHRAFVTMLFDDGKLILQRRRHWLFDGLWDLTAISHPQKEGRKIETYQQASDRAIKKEMGIGHVEVKKIGAFNYFARDGKNCEREYCAVLTGEFAGKITPNVKEVYEYKKVNFRDFLLDIKKNPKKYTPWAKLAVLEFSKKDFPFMQEEMEKFLSEFLKYQKKFFTKKAKDVSKYPSLIVGFYRDLADFSSRGKKLRPFLVYLGWKLCGKKELRKILPISLAFELIHCFLLIHDDIVDRSDVRRGKLTIHKKYENKFGPHYGISQAIILGDIACFEAFKLIAESAFSGQTKKVLINKFAEVLLETGYGEALDVEYSYREAGLKDINAVTNLKTARYSFVGPLVLGAAAGGAGKSLLSRLTKFALPLGSAFQLTDDILGTFGEEEQTGKSPLSDLVEGKNTLLIYKAKELTGPKNRKVLSRIWGKKTADISELEKVRKIIEESGALSWAKAESGRMIIEAKVAIGDLSTNSKMQGMLAEFADFIVARNN